MHCEACGVALQKEAFPAEVIEKRGRAPVRVRSDGIGGADVECVTVDGREIGEAFEADEIAGYVRHYAVRNQDGTLRTLRQHERVPSGAMLVETETRGFVVVHFRSEA